MRQYLSLLVAGKAAVQLVYLSCFEWSELLYWVDIFSAGTMISCAFVVLILTDGKTETQFMKIVSYVLCSWSEYRIRLSETRKLLQELA